MLPAAGAVDETEADILPSLLMYGRTRGLLEGPKLLQVLKDE